MYSKEIVPHCMYCRNAISSPIEGHMVCHIKGVVAEDFSCKKYAYDPIKRIPARRPHLQTSDFNPSDFEI